MRHAIKVANGGGDGCSNTPTCPGVWDDQDPTSVVVQVVASDEVAPADIGVHGAPAGDRFFRVPRSMWEDRS